MSYTWFQNGFANWVSELDIRCVPHQARHTMQFDHRGNRTWRQAKALLDTERVRRAVGEGAVPYGSCSEPSNVAAGGDDCPVRFRCVGCAHFSTDISYLPDLETYLADLLSNRERLLATVEVDHWAKAEAMPRDARDQPRPPADRPGQSRPGRPHPG